MIAVKETDEMTTLAEAAEAYRATKEAHKRAAEEARAAVLAALQAGFTVPEVTKAGPFTYAYVRGIAEDNNIPRDERKARYPKHHQDPEPVSEIAGSSATSAKPVAQPPFTSSTMTTDSRVADLLGLAADLAPAKQAQVAERIRSRHALWLRGVRPAPATNAELIDLACRANVATYSDLRP